MLLGCLSGKCLVLRWAWVDVREGGWWMMAFLGCSTVSDTWLELCAGASCKRPLGSGCSNGG
jgi:hypothetical protein